MNLRQLKTLVTFFEHGSFAAAGDKVGLSHSAISVQMQRLEEELGGQLFDRQSRPPTLTPEGHDVALIARDILGLVESIKRISVGDVVSSSLTIGLVPTALQYTLPVVLEKLQQLYPSVQISIKSGLSGELAAAVLRRELDFALISSPITAIPELKVIEVAQEPLYAIAPRSIQSGSSLNEMLSALPFITFNKRTWLGQQIGAQLQARGLHLNEAMEIDAFDVIEQLVARGYGVSIVPKRVLSPSFSKEVTVLPFGNPVETRRLVLVEHIHGRNTALEHAVRSVFQSLEQIVDD